jgi:ribosome maturation factor RimP
LSRQMKHKKGTESFPSSFPMSTEAAKHFVETQVQAMLESEPAYFLVEAGIRPLNQIRVFIDGDQGISIEKCIQFNRNLYKKIDESGLFPAGDFSLEVSSPGLEEPLKLWRQYQKNIGREVDVQLADGTKRSGRLTEVDPEGLVVEETRGKILGGRYPRQGKKPEQINHRLLFTQIKSTTIQVVF